MNKSNEEILEDLMYNAETDSILEIFGKKDDKRQIKNEPKKVENKQYKGRNLKTKIATILLALGIGVGATVAGNAIYNNGYDKGFDEATAYSDMTNQDIKEEIKEILIDEYTKATGANKEEVSFEFDMDDTDFTRTEVSDSKNSFKYQYTAGAFNTGNLKATQYRGLISDLITRGNTSTKRELIDLLKKTREYSNKKDLIVKGNDLKEIKDQGIEK